MMENHMMGTEFALRAALEGGVVPLQSGGIIPTGSRVNVFREIFTVFLVLGTVVGVVVIGYALYNAYKYRDGDGDGVDADVDRPELGEIPRGGGGGRKLALSFTLSTVIVLSLILWTYGTLLYVEQDSPVDNREDAITVDVEGFQFGWAFRYPNGLELNGEFRVPVDTPVRLNVTSRDTFHNFGIPSLRAKTDAIPGQATTTWLLAEEPGTHTAKCFELCGPGHSQMTAEVIVMPDEEYRDWYESTNATEGS